MGSLFYILIPLALLLTVAVLFMGLFSMARGGATDAKWSNRLMRLRVLMQLVAILLIAVALTFSNH
jgi:hypothetical protein